MRSKKQQYEICKERKHVKSGQTISKGGVNWSICKYCEKLFRYVTSMEEYNG